MEVFITGILEKQDSRWSVIIKFNTWSSWSALLKILKVFTSNNNEKTRHPIPICSWNALLLASNMMIIKHFQKDENKEFD